MMSQIRVPVVAISEKVIVTFIDFGSSLRTMICTCKSTEYGVRLRT